MSESSPNGRQHVVSLLELGRVHLHTCRNLMPECFPGSSSKTTKTERLTLSKLDFYFLARIKIRSQKKVSSSQKYKIAISKNRKIAYNCIYIVNFRKLRIFGFTYFPKIYNANAVISDFSIFRNR